MRHKARLTKKQENRIPHVTHIQDVKYILPADSIIAKLPFIITLVEKPN